MDLEVADRVGRSRRVFRSGNGGLRVRVERGERGEKERSGYKII